jgi:hyperosmotically inducible protein
MKKSLVPAVLALLSLPALGQAQTTTAPSPAPDNSKVNQRDQAPGAPTAGQQKGKADLDVTRGIRQAIVKDKTLSTYAHNVKIITQAGVVTLRGPVRSAEEKTAIEALATQVAGDGNVKDELEIAPKKGS